MLRAESGGLPRALAGAKFEQKPKASLLRVDLPKKWGPSQGAQKQTSVGISEGSAESEHALLLAPRKGEIGGKEFAWCNLWRLPSLNNCGDDVRVQT